MRPLEISDERLHGLAQPLGYAFIDGVKPVLIQYSFDESIHPTELTCAVIYSNCQSIGSMIDTQTPDEQEQLRELVRRWLKL